MSEVQLKDNPQLISPPIIKEPVYGCANSVTFLSFEPHVEIDIEIDGVIQNPVQVEYQLQRKYYPSRIDNHC